MDSFSRLTKRILPTHNIFIFILKLISDQNNTYHPHHHKRPGLSHLTRSVSRFTAALSIASSVSQLFSFLVGCRGMISRGFGFVALLLLLLLLLLLRIISCFNYVHFSRTQLGRETGAGCISETQWNLVLPEKLTAPHLIK